jgi:hypothetical protein
VTTVASNSCSIVNITAGYAMSGVLQRGLHGGRKSFIGAG